MGKKLPEITSTISLPGRAFAWFLNDEILPETRSASLPKLFKLVEGSPQAIAKAMTILNKMSKEQPQNYSQLQELKHTYNLQLFQYMLRDAAFAKENKALLNASTPEELQEIYGHDVHLENLKKNIFELLQLQKDLHNNPALKLIQDYVNFCLNDQQLSAALNVFNHCQLQVDAATKIIALLEKDFTTASLVLNNHRLTSTCDDDDEEADKILRSSAGNVLQEVVSQIQKRVFHAAHAEQTNITPQEKQFLARTEFVLPILIKAKAEGVEELTKNILKLKAEGKLNDQYEGGKHSYYKKAIESLNSLSLGQDGQDKIAQWNLRYKTVEQELGKLSGKQLSFWSSSTLKRSENPHEIRIGNHRKP
jgi:murein DD-endopeptidase MepM/ murein hydrolase activator NlpD